MLPPTAQRYTELPTTRPVIAEMFCAPADSFTQVGAGEVVVQFALQKRIVPELPTAHTSSVGGFAPIVTLAAKTPLRVVVTPGSVSGFQPTEGL